MRRAALSLLATLTLVAPAAAEILRFTLPSKWAGADGCSPGLVALDSLSLVELWRLDGAVTLERARPAGAPGTEETLLVLPGPGQVSYCVITRAPGSQPSCRSNLVTFNGRVDAGPAGGPGAGPWLGLPRPNPTHGLLAVPWCLPSAATARLEVVDLAGRVVSRPVDGACEPGVHVALWDARAAAPGIYLVRVRAGGWTATRRVLVLR